jgi:hypothetical protein
MPDVAQPPDHQQLLTLLHEAQAQYAAHPTDYLEGVVVSLMRALDMFPIRDWCDDERQARNAANRPPTDRVRDYLNGSRTALQWVDGVISDPPVSTVYTGKSDPPEGLM